MLRAGILGGTFDPVHFGHLRAAEEIREELALEKVWFIPGASPPHKNNNGITSFEDRIEMVNLALKGSRFHEVLDLEGRRKGPSYSIETLREIKACYKNEIELFFIIGIDAFRDIKTWKQFKGLFEVSNFAVINRPGACFEDFNEFVRSLNAGFEPYSDRAYRNRFGNILIHKDVTNMDISSTKIREMISAGKSVRFLLPDQVIDYIERKGLYYKNGFS